MKLDIVGAVPCVSIPIAGQVIQPDPQINQLESLCCQEILLQVNEENLIMSPNHVDSEIEQVLVNRYHLQHLLGKGQTLETAITELLNLPQNDNRPSQVLQLLTNWRVSLQRQNPLATEEPEFLATLSQAYLGWEQKTLEQGEQRGHRDEAIALTLRQLTRRLSLQSLPESLRSQVQQLSLPRLESLSEGLLDFQTLADLEEWLGE